MNRCPECSRPISSATVKCECGYRPTRAVRARLRATDSRDGDADRDADRDDDRGGGPEALARASRRYPALRTTSAAYRVLAWIVGVVGMGKVLVDLLPSTPPGEIASAPAAAATLNAVRLTAIGIEAAGVVFAVVTCLAVSESIRLLLEASEHWRMSAR